MGDLVVHIERDAKLGDDVLRLLKADVCVLVLLLRECVDAFFDKLQAPVVEHEGQRLRRRRQHLLLLICFRSTVYHMGIPLASLCSKEIELRRQTRDRSLHRVVLFVEAVFKRGHELLEVAHLLLVILNESAQLTHIGLVR